MSNIILKTKRLIKRIINILVTIVALPIVILIFVIRPIIIIRFGTLISGRIGHFSGDVEAYLCKQKTLSQKKRHIDIIGCPRRICNSHLKSMWERTFKITPWSKLWGALDRACKFWTLGDIHHVRLYDNYSDYKLFLSTAPFLQLSEREKFNGQKLLAGLGIPEGSRWVCIHNRDTLYLDTISISSIAYHDYRNFSINTMLEASKELVRRGYYVVRMGSLVEEELISDNPKIIDYASSSLRNDFGDIYLAAKCSAYIGSDSGIALLPLIFRKPIFFINYSASLINIMTRYNPNPIIIKRLWHNENKHFLSLRQIFKAGLIGAARSDIFKKAGIKVIDNTPEEIRDLVIEIDERINGLWKPLPEDIKLQQKFLDIFYQYAHKDQVGEVKARLGTAFLRQHKDLLD